MAQAALDGLGSKTDVSKRIVEPSLLETFQAELATVAQPAGASLWRRIIATPGETIVYAKFNAFSNDLSLGHFNQRHVNLDPALAFRSGLGRQIGHRLEGADVFVSAVRIAAVIELVSAEEDISGFDTLR